MNIRSGIGIVIFALLSLTAYSQVQIGVNVTPQCTFNRPLQNLEYSGLSISPFTGHLLPEYVQRNPQNYSYLCRLELDLEKKLAVPVWLKMEDNKKLGEGLTNNVYVRLKLLRF